MLRLLFNRNKVLGWLKWIAPCDMFWLATSFPNLKRFVGRRFQQLEYQLTLIAEAGHVQSTSREIHGDGMLPLRIYFLNSKDVSNTPNSLCWSGFVAMVRSKELGWEMKHWKYLEVSGSIWKCCQALGSLGSSHCSPRLYRCSRPLDSRNFPLPAEDQRERRFGLPGKAHALASLVPERTPPMEDDLMKVYISGDCGSYGLRFLHRLRKHHNVQVWYHSVSLQVCSCLYIKKAQVIPPGLIGGRMGGYTQRERERER